MLRVLHITVRADHSGGPRHVYDLIKGMRHEAEAFVACPPERPFRERFAELLGAERVFPIPHRQVSMSALMRLRGLIRQAGIEIVHSHGRGAGFYSRPLAGLTGVKCVHTFHYLNPSSRLRAIEERVMAWGANAVVAVSRSEAEYVRRARVVGGDKLHLILNGVEVSESVPASLPVRKIVGIMRLELDKSPAIFAEVCRSLSGSGLSFRVVGSGSLLQRLRASDPEIFAGAVDEPRQYLTPDSVYLATSQGEGLSLAMLDAMACGIPVVASNVPGNADLIRDGENGLLYPWGDAKLAAELILRIMGDDDLRRRLSAGAWRSVSQDYRVEAMVEQVLALYRRI